MATLRNFRHFALVTMASMTTSVFAYGPAPAVEGQPTITSETSSFETASLQTTNTAVEPQPASDNAARNRPQHILFIAVDDLNDWIDTMDGSARVQTPNITRLADRGMLFTQAFAPGTSCTPSRTAILTGMSPFNSGLYSHNTDWRADPRLSQLPTLPRYFRDNGYATFGAGKLFHAHTYTYAGVTGQADTSAWNGYFPSVDRQLPDQIVPAAGRYAGSEAAGRGRGTAQFDFAPVVVRDEAMGDGQVVSYISERLADQYDQPSFIAAGIFRPHLPWYVPERFFDMYPVEDIELPPWRVDDLDDVPAQAPFGFEPGIGRDAMAWVMEPLTTLRWRQAIQGYLASASYADFAVGQLLDALDRSGRAENTIIVLWSDHGYHLGEKSRWGKMTLWERTAHVPFIVVAPGVTTPGSRSNEAVSTLDIYATLADLAGLDRPDHIDGRSLVPLLRNPSMDWGEVAITVHTFGNYSVRDDRYRYIVYEDGSEELYDLIADPNEWTNLVADDQYASVIHRLRDEIPDEQAEPQTGEGDARVAENALEG